MNLSTDSLKMLFKGSDLADIKYIPTGIFALDTAISGGKGLPLGRASLLVGDKSSGKTTTTILAASSFQRHCRNCCSALEKCKCAKKKKEPMRVLFIDMEGHFDKVWASMLGMNVKEAFFATPKTAEEGFGLVTDSVYSGEFDLIIFDSIASSALECEIGDITKEEVGKIARLVNRLCRQLYASFNSLSRKKLKLPHLILLNQYRSGIGQFSGGNVITGGRGQGFLASITVELRRPGRVGENGIINPDKVPDYQKLESHIESIGTLHKFEVTKNKMYPPFKKGSYIVYNQRCENDIFNVSAGEINNVEQILSYAIKYNVVEKSGSWYSFKDCKLGQGKIKSANALKQDVDNLLDPIVEAVLQNIEKLR